MRVEKIVERAGGVRNVAEELGLSTQSIYAWFKAGYVPIKHMRAVAKLANMDLDKMPIP